MQPQIQPSIQTKSHQQPVIPNGYTMIDPSTLLSPTAAALLSQRNSRTNTKNSIIGSNIGPPHVVVPNANDFNPIKPILTPVHIPYLQQQQNNINNGQSQINSGFQSPINYIILIHHNHH